MKVQFKTILRGAAISAAMVPALFFHTACSPYAGTQKGYTFDARQATALSPSTVSQAARAFTTTNSTVSSDPISGFTPFQPGPVQPSFSNPLALYITALYRVVLQRTPSYLEVNNWIGAYGNGTNILQIALAFFSSTERNTNLVRYFYSHFLNRAPESQVVIDTHVSTITNQGVDVDISKFLGSAEFYNLHLATSQGWVTGVYSVLYNRTPDSTGLANWLASLNAGNSRESVALAMVRSLEFATIRVQGWFQAYLGRAGSSSEVSQWATVLLASPANVNYYLVVFVTSREFISRLLGGFRPIDPIIGGGDNSDCFNSVQSTLCPMNCIEVPQSSCSTSFAASPQLPSFLVFSGTGCNSCLATQDLKLSACRHGLSAAQVSSLVISCQ